MLRIAVIDCTAESRNRITEEINGFLNSALHEASLLPPATVRPFSFQELKFNSAPDICIVGEQTVAREISTISQLRKLLPDTPILVRLDESLDNLGTIEQVLASGADDVISTFAADLEFFKKLAVFSRKIKKAQNGKMILVDSGKGGIGVSSIVAALGEAICENDKKVALVDFDFDTQDLSRFLQVRPFVNENLELLFSGTRPITEEFVEQCVIPVWEEQEGLYCMSPCLEPEDFNDLHSGYIRKVVSLLEILDDMFDVVVIDTGSVRGGMLKTLYRLADQVLFLINSDPATLFASADKIGRYRTLMSPDARLSVLINRSTSTGLPENVLQREFSKAANLQESEWCPIALPHSKLGSRWPGSGQTLFTFGNEGVRRAITAYLEAVEIVDAEPSVDKDRPSPISKVASVLFAGYQKVRPGKKTIYVEQIDKKDRKTTLDGLENRLLLNAQERKELLEELMPDAHQVAPVQKTPEENEQDPDFQELLKRANLS
ncbi:MAG: P-loop NTPase [Bdellovibrionales bacterium]|nr:P-loop NTPase [Bdellovibrionales bacterium]